MIKSPFNIKFLFDMTRTLRKFIEQLLLSEKIYPPFKCMLKNIKPCIFENEKYYMGIITDLKTEIDVLISEKKFCEVFDIHEEVSFVTNFMDIYKLRRCLVCDFGNLPNHSCFKKNSELVDKKQIQNLKVFEKQHILCQNTNTVNFNYFKENSKSLEENLKSLEENSQSFEDNPKSFEKISKSYAKIPKSFEGNPKFFEENPKSFEKNPKSYEKNPKSYEKNPKPFDKNPKSFEENSKSFEENSIYFEENLKSFEENSKSFEENSKHFEENSKSFEVNECVQKHSVEKDQNQYEKNLQSKNFYQNDGLHVEQLLSKNNNKKPINIDKSDLINDFKYNIGVVNEYLDSRNSFVSENMNSFLKYHSNNDISIDIEDFKTSCLVENTQKTNTRNLQNVNMNQYVHKNINRNNLQNNHNNQGTEKSGQEINFQESLINENETNLQETQHYESILQKELFKDFYVENTPEISKNRKMNRSNYRNINELIDFDVDFFQKEENFVFIKNIEQLYARNFKQATKRKGFSFHKSQQTFQLLLQNQTEMFLKNKQQVISQKGINSQQSVLSTRNLQIFSNGSLTCPDSSFEQIQEEFIDENTERNDKTFLQVNNNKEPSIMHILKSKSQTNGGLSLPNSAILSNNSAGNEIKSLQKRKNINSDFKNYSIDSKTNEYLPERSILSASNNNRFMEISSPHTDSKTNEYLPERSILSASNNNRFMETSSPHTDFIAQHLIIPDSNLIQTSQFESNPSEMSTSSYNILPEYISFDPCIIMFFDRYEIRFNGNFYLIIHDFIHEELTNTVSVYKHVSECISISSMIRNLTFSDCFYNRILDKYNSFKKNKPEESVRDQKNVTQKNHFQSSSEATNHFSNRIEYIQNQTNKNQEKDPKMENSYLKKQNGENNNKFQVFGSVDFDLQMKKDTKSIHRSFKSTFNKGCSQKDKIIAFLKIKPNIESVFLKMDQSYNNLIHVWLFYCGYMPKNLITLETYLFNNFLFSCLLFLYKNFGTVFYHKDKGIVENVLYNFEKNNCFKNTIVTNNYLLTNNKNHLFSKNVQNSAELYQKESDLVFKEFSDSTCVNKTQRFYEEKNHLESSYHNKEENLNSFLNPELNKKSSEFLNEKDKLLTDSTCVNKAERFSKEKNHLESSYQNKEENVNPFINPELNKKSSESLNKKDKILADINNTPIISINQPKSHFCENTYSKDFTVSTNSSLNQIIDANENKISEKSQQSRLKNKNQNKKTPETFFSSHFIDNGMLSQDFISSALQKLEDLDIGSKIKIPLNEFFEKNRMKIPNSTEDVLLNKQEQNNLQKMFVDLYQDQIKNNLKNFYFSILNSQQDIQTVKKKGASNKSTTKKSRKRVCVRKKKVLFKEIDVLKEGVDITEHFKDLMPFFEVKKINIFDLSKIKNEYLEFQKYNNFLNSLQFIQKTKVKRKMKSDLFGPDFYEKPKKCVIKVNEKSFNRFYEFVDICKDLFLSLTQHHKNITKNQNNETHSRQIATKAISFTNNSQNKDLKNSHLQNKDLKNSHSQKRHSQNKDLKNSHLQNSHLQNSHSQKRHSQNKDLKNSHLQNKDLKNSHLQNKDLKNSHSQKRHSQNKDLKNSHLQIKDLKNSHLQNSHSQKRDLKINHSQNIIKNEVGVSKIYKDTSKTHLLNVKSEGSHVFTITDIFNTKTEGNDIGLHHETFHSIQELDNKKSNTESDVKKLPKILIDKTESTSNKAVCMLSENVLTTENKAFSEQSNNQKVLTKNNNNYVDILKTQIDKNNYVDILKTEIDKNNYKDILKTQIDKNSLAIPENNIRNIDGFSSTDCDDFTKYLETIKEIANTKPKTSQKENFIVLTQKISKCNLIDESSDFWELSDEENKNDIIDLKAFSTTQNSYTKMSLDNLGSLKQSKTKNCEKDDNIIEIISNLSTKNYINEISNHQKCQGSHIIEEKHSRNFFFQKIKNEDLKIATKINDNLTEKNIQKMILETDKRKIPHFKGISENCGLMSEKNNQRRSFVKSIDNPNIFSSIIHPHNDVIFSKNQIENITNKEEAKMNAFCNQLEKNMNVSVQKQQDDVFYSEEEFLQGFFYKFEHIFKRMFSIQQEELEPVKKQKNVKILCFDGNLNQKTLFKKASKFYDQKKADCRYMPFFLLQFLYKLENYFYMLIKKNLDVFNNPPYFIKKDIFRFKEYIKTHLCNENGHFYEKNYFRYQEIEPTLLEVMNQFNDSLIQNRRDKMSLSYKPNQLKSHNSLQNQKTCENLSFSDFSYWNSINSEGNQQKHTTPTNSLSLENTLKTDIVAVSANIQFHIQHISNNLEVALSNNKCDEEYFDLLSDHLDYSEESRRSFVNSFIQNNEKNEVKMFSQDFDEIFLSSILDIQSKENKIKSLKEINKSRTLECFLLSKNPFINPKTKDKERKRVIAQNVYKKEADLRLFATNSSQLPSFNDSECYLQSINKLPPVKNTNINYAMNETQKKIIGAINKRKTANSCLKADSSENQDSLSQKNQVLGIQMKNKGAVKNLSVSVHYSESSLQTFNDSKNSHLSERNSHLSERNSHLSEKNSILSEKNSILSEKLVTKNYPLCSSNLKKKYQEENKTENCLNTKYKYKSICDAAKTINQPIVENFAVKKIIAINPIKYKPIETNESLTMNAVSTDIRDFSSQSTLKKSSFSCKRSLFNSQCISSSFITSKKTKLDGHTSTLEYYQIKNKSRSIFNKKHEFVMVKSSQDENRNLLRNSFKHLKKCNVYVCEGENCNKHLYCHSLEPKSNIQVIFKHFKECNILTNALIKLYQFITSEILTKVKMNCFHRDCFNSHIEDSIISFHNTKPSKFCSNSLLYIPFLSFFNNFAICKFGVFLPHNYRFILIYDANLQKLLILDKEKSHICEFENTTYSNLKNFLLYFSSTNSKHFCFLNSRNKDFINYFILNHQYVVKKMILYQVQKDNLDISKPIANNFHQNSLSIFRNQNKRRKLGIVLNKTEDFNLQNEPDSNTIYFSQELTDFDFSNINICSINGDGEENSNTDVFYSENLIGEDKSCIDGKKYLGIKSDFLKNFNNNKILGQSVLESTFNLHTQPFRSDSGFYRNKKRKLICPLNVVTEKDLYEYTSKINNYDHNKIKENQNSTDTQAIEVISENFDYQISELSFKNRFICEVSQNKTKTGVNSVSTHTEHIIEIKKQYVLRDLKRYSYQNIKDSHFKKSYFQEICCLNKIRYLQDFYYNNIPSSTFKNSEHYFRFRFSVDCHDIFKKNSIVVDSLSSYNITPKIKNNRNEIADFKKEESFSIKEISKKFNFKFYSYFYQRVNKNYYRISKNLETRDPLYHLRSMKFILLNKKIQKRKNNMRRYHRKKLISTFIHSFNVYLPSLRGVFAISNAEISVFDYFFTFLDSQAYHAQNMQLYDINSIKTYLIDFSATVSKEPCFRVIYNCPLKWFKNMLIFANSWGESGYQFITFFECFLSYLFINGFNTRKWYKLVSCTIPRFKMLCVFSYKHLGTNSLKPILGILDPFIRFKIQNNAKRYVKRYLKAILIFSREIVCFSRIRIALYKDFMLKNGFIVSYSKIIDHLSKSHSKKQHFSCDSYSIHNKIPMSEIHQITQFKKEGRTTNQKKLNCVKNKHKITHKFHIFDSKQIIILRKLYKGFIFSTINNKNLLEAYNSMYFLQNKINLDLLSDISGNKSAISILHSTNLKISKNKKFLEKKKKILDKHEFIQTKPFKSNFISLNQKHKHFAGKWSNFVPSNIFYKKNCNKLRFFELSEHEHAKYFQKSSQNRFLLKNILNLQILKNKEDFCESNFINKNLNGLKKNKGIEKKELHSFCEVNQSLTQIYQKNSINGFKMINKGENQHGLVRLNPQKLENSDKSNFMCSKINSDNENTNIKTQKNTGECKTNQNIKTFSISEPIKLISNKLSELSHNSYVCNDKSSNDTFSNQNNEFKSKKSHKSILTHSDSALISQNKIISPRHLFNNKAYTFDSSNSSLLFLNNFYEQNSQGNSIINILNNNPKSVSINVGPNLVKKEIKENENKNLFDDKALSLNSATDFSCLISEIKFSNNGNNKKTLLKNESQKKHQNFYVERNQIFKHSLAQKNKFDTGFGNSNVFSQNSLGSNHWSKSFLSKNVRKILVKSKKNKTQPSVKTKDKNIKLLRSITDFTSKITKEDWNVQFAKDIREVSFKPSKANLNKKFILKTPKRSNKFNKKMPMSQLTNKSEQFQNHSPELIKTTLVSENHSPELIKTTFLSENNSSELIKTTFVSENHSSELTKTTFVSENHSPELTKTTLVSENHSPELIKTTLVSENHSPELIKTTLVSENNSSELMKTTFLSENNSSELIKTTFLSENNSPELTKTTFVSENHSPELTKTTFVSENHSSELIKTTFGFKNKHQNNAKQNMLYIKNENDFQKNISEKYSLNLLLQLLNNSEHLTLYNSPQKLDIITNEGVHELGLMQEKTSLNDLKKKYISKILSINNLSKSYSKKISQIIIGILWALKLDASKFHNFLSDCLSKKGVLSILLFCFGILFENKNHIFVRNNADDFLVLKSILGQVFSRYTSQIFYQTYTHQNSAIFLENYIESKKISVMIDCTLNSQCKFQKRSPNSLCNISFDFDSFQDYFSKESVSKIEGAFRLLLLVFRNEHILKQTQFYVKNKNYIHTLMERSNLIFGYTGFHVFNYKNKFHGDTSNMCIIFNIIENLSVYFFFESIINLEDPNFIENALKENKLELGAFLTDSFDIVNAFVSNNQIHKNHYINVIGCKKENSESFVHKDDNSLTSSLLAKITALSQESRGRHEEGIKLNKEHFSDNYESLDSLNTITYTDNLKFFSDSSISTRGFTESDHESCLNPTNNVNLVVLENKISRDTSENQEDSLEGSEYENFSIMKEKNKNTIPKTKSKKNQELIHQNNHKFIKRRKLCISSSQPTLQNKSPRFFSLPSPTSNSSFSSQPNFIKNSLACKQIDFCIQKNSKSYQNCIFSKDRKDVIDLDHLYHKKYSNYIALNSKDPETLEKSQNVKKQTVYYIIDNNHTEGIEKFKIVKKHADCFDINNNNTKIAEKSQIVKKLPVYYLFDNKITKVVEKSQNVKKQAIYYIINNNETQSIEKSLSFSICDCLNAKINNLISKKESINYNECRHPLRLHICEHLNLILFCEHMYRFKHTENTCLDLERSVEPIFCIQLSDFIMFIEEHQKSKQLPFFDAYIVKKFMFIEIFSRVFRTTQCFLVSQLFLKIRRNLFHLLRENLSEFINIFYYSKKSRVEVSVYSHSNYNESLIINLIQVYKNVCENIHKMQKKPNLLPNSNIKNDMLPLYEIINNTNTTRFKIYKKSTTAVRNMKLTKFNELKHFYTGKHSCFRSVNEKNFSNKKRKIDQTFADAKRFHSSDVLLKLSHRLNKALDLVRNRLPTNIEKQHYIVLKPDTSLKNQKSCFSVIKNEKTLDLSNTDNPNSNLAYSHDSSTIENPNYMNKNNEPLCSDVSTYLYRNKKGVFSNNKYFIKTGPVISTNTSKNTICHWENEKHNYEPHNLLQKDIPNILGCIEAAEKDLKQKTHEEFIKKDIIEKIINKNVQFYTDQEFLSYKIQDPFSEDSNTYTDISYSLNSNPEKSDTSFQK